MSGHRSSRLVPSQQFSVPPGPEMPLHLPYTYSTLGAAIKASLEAMLWTVRAATTPLCCQYCSKVEFTIIVVRTKCRWFPTHSQVGVSVQHPRGKGSICGWAESGSALNAPWCEEIRGDVRGWPWAYLLPSVALLLLSGFTTPTLGGRGGSNGLARPPAAEKPMQKIPSRPFNSMTQYFAGNFSREFRRNGKQQGKCVALSL